MADQLLSSEETTKRWKYLLEVSNLNVNTRQRKRLKRSSPVAVAVDDVDDDDKSDGGDNNDDDPFDCRSIAVNRTHDLVEDTLNSFAKEWKQLEDRKIRNVSTSGGTCTGSGLSNDRPDNKEGLCIKNSATATTVNTNKISNNSKAVIRRPGGWRWVEDRLSLPERFADFSGIAPGDDGISGDRVISLDDPTQTLSYHNELWKLFKTIPNYRQLERTARGDGNQICHTRRVYEETHSLKESTADCHKSSRLRMSDRHGLPAANNVPVYQPSSNDELNDTSSSSHIDTITFELWRRQPRRGASSDCHRMVLEFLSNQTLWDLHMVLSQMAEDVVWNSIISNDADLGTTSTTAMVGVFNGQRNSTLKERNAVHENHDNDNVDGDDIDNRYEPSGCFFIENTFYKTGSVDYTKNIVDWIDRNDSSKPNPIRRSYLGISSSVPIANDKTMKETKLGQVPFRLNIRYYHACHGDVQTAVMLVDRKFVQLKVSNKGKNDDHQQTSLYPLIHDIWTEPRVPTVPVCDACQMLQAVFVTSTDCSVTDGGPRYICHECCSDLKLLDTSNKDFVKLFIPWRSQRDLSNTIASEHSTIF